MIDKWPGKVVFIGPSALDDQREFAAQAVTDAPTGTAYTHYDEFGRVIVYREQPLAAVDSKKKAHACTSHPSGRCQVCRKPPPWRHGRP